MDAARATRTGPAVRAPLLLALLALVLIVPGASSAHPAPGVPLAGPHAAHATPVLPTPRIPAPHAASNWWNITLLSAAVPAGRTLASSTWDPVDDSTVMFSGTDAGTSTTLNDTWSFSNGTWTQLFPTVSPEGRAFGSMAWDTADGYGVLFGGLNASGTILGDTWTYLHGVWTNLSPLNSPQPRYAQQMAYDPATSSIILFGGTNASGFALSDTWSFSHGTWSELSPVAHPPGLTAAGFTYDASDGYLLMFGGTLNDSDFGATHQVWEFSGSTWNQVTPATLPPVVLAPAFTYDPLTQTVLDLGGADRYNGAESGFWSYHAGAWTELSASPPPGGRYGSLFVWQPNANYLLMNGGVFEAVENSSPEFQVDDSWAYAPALGGSAAGVPAATDLGHAIHFHSLPTGGVAPFTEAWQFGDGANATGETPTHGYVHAGNYTVHLNVTDAVGELFSTSVLISVNLPPAVAMGVPLPPHGSTGLVVGQSYSFSAHGASGTLPYAYSWKFGDGATGTGNLTTHAYAAAGDYTVSVELTDADGATSNASAQVSLVANTSGQKTGNASMGLPSGLLLYVILAIVIVAAVGIAAWAVMRRKRSPPPAAAPPGVPPPGWMAPPAGAAPPPPPPPAGPPPTG